MNVQQWSDALAAELGVDPSAVDLKLILDLARDAAHGVERPAAPVTTFLLGFAAGRGDADVATVAARIEALLATLAPAPTED